MENEWEKPGYEDDETSDEDVFWGEESDEI